MKEAFHWADQSAERVIKERGNKKKYVCAAGITPSGTVHIGNFREIITVDLVTRALKEKKKNVRFIYSWDDYDRLRKIPKNVPEEFERYIGMPISDVPDPGKCHNSYAEHFEKELEYSLSEVGIKPEFIRQNLMYKSCKYAEEIKTALNNRDKIRKILDKYRKEPLKKDWYPLTVYCEMCKTDFTKILSYNNEYEIEYECKCGHKNKINFRKKGNVKLSWRVDWAGRQYFEDVDFEPAGKDHYAAGGSRITANEIIESIWKRKHPIDLAYEWIGIKGGKQFSSSSGNVLTLNDCLEIYEPEIIRYLFASTRPDTEFAISFDLDVIKIYSDFDKCERIYFGKEEISKEKLAKEKRIYEFSCIKIPKKMPFQASFRHLAMLMQIYNGDIKEVNKNFDEDVGKRAIRSWNWVQKYAPEDFRFKIQDKIEIKLDEQEKKALRLLVNKLEKNKYNEDSLFNEFYKICSEVEINNIDFFKAAYKVLINKEKGPRLASFILAIGKEKIIKLLKQIK